MTSIKVKFRPSSIKGKEGRIYYQIIQQRTVRQLKTKYRIFADEWNKTKASIIVKNTRNNRYHYLFSIQEHIIRDLRQLEKIIYLCKRNSSNITTADDVIQKFQDFANEQSFFSFMKKVIIQLKRLHRERTAEAYIATLNDFLRFRKNKDIILDAINSDLMKEYEAYLKARGITMNTISFYMRVLRAVYNRAIEEGATAQRNPFKHVYTGVDKTVKRAVTIAHIRKIKELDLTAYPATAFARNMFMFSFYTRGMSFVDMAYLKKSDLKNGMLTYRRRKTGQQLSIKWEKCMQEIVDKYNTPFLQASPYLLPIIKTPNTEKARQQYKNKLYMVNTHLKQGGELIDLPIPLSTYVARHSWASIAKNKNIPVSVISEGMGHGSETTTQIYLASLECSIIDKANSLILKDL